MRCLTQAEITTLFGDVGFSISRAQDWYRLALVLDATIASKQSRIGGRPTQDISRLAQFAEALNRWLPTDHPRLLWIEHWTLDYPNTYDLFVAARGGLGETRSLLENFLDTILNPTPYHEEDQMNIAPEHAKQTGILIGLMALVMINRWDGWLIAQCNTDRIEFWEGNIFFHATESCRLTDAQSLMAQFDCPLNLI